MEKSTFELINELIVSISKMLWPVFAFIVVLMFKKEIKGILIRLKRGKFFGQEVELSEEIDKFEKNINKATNEIPDVVQTEEMKQNEPVLPDEFAVLNEPKIGIMILAREIEKEVRILIASLGLLGERNFIRIQDAFELLEKRSALPKYTASSLKIFWDLRNRIVHGKEVENENDIVRVLDIGITLLKTLKAVPHETNIVYHPGVEIYSNPECTNKVEGVKGLILETTSPGGIEKSLRIFPTTKDYIKGKKVSWEWDLSRIWGESWYIHPDTCEKKYAWTSSGEFIGRDINEI